MTELDHGKACGGNAEGPSSPTIKVEQFRAAAQKDTDGGHHYKGLRIHTRPGLHDEAGKWAQRSFNPNDLVLDVAAGSGAMSLRLMDMGLRVHALDLVPENFRLHGQVPFETVDLNQNFLSETSNAYDGIVAVEIIEHLENPRHFFRQCYRLLRPGGTLLLTTPNIDSPGSQALFCRTGRFMWFSDQNYGHEGHITPMSQWQLSACAREAGFAHVDFGSFGDSLENFRGWPKMRMFAAMLRRVSQNPARPLGEILIAAWRKPPR